MKVISQINPRVPYDPTINLEMSYPDTFLTVFPPVPTTSPLGATKRTPKSKSRGNRYNSRLGPLELAATIPPMVAVSLKGGSMGRKQPLLLRSEQINSSCGVARSSRGR